MKHRLLVVDDFFHYPNAIREALLRREFKEYLSPWDGVTYPGICEDVPFWIGGDMSSETSKTEARSERSRRTSASLIRTHSVTGNQCSPFRADSTGSSFTTQTSGTQHCLSVASVHRSATGAWS